MTFNVERSGHYETNLLRPGVLYDPWWVLFKGADIDSKLAVAVRTDRGFTNDPKYVSRRDDSQDNKILNGPATIHETLTSHAGAVGY
jgi:hypothetical protein